MIKINFNEEITYGFEREELEKVLNDKINENSDFEMNPIVKQTLKSSISMILPMIGIHRTEEDKDLDNIEFLKKTFFKMILDELERGTIQVEAKVIEE